MIPTKKTLTQKSFYILTSSWNYFCYRLYHTRLFSQGPINAGYVKFQWNDMIRSQAYIIYPVFCDTIWAKEKRYIFFQSVQVSIQITYESLDIHAQNASVLLTFFSWNHMCTFLMLSYNRVLLHLSVTIAHDATFSVRREYFKDRYC